VRHKGWPQQKVDVRHSNTNLIREVALKLCGFRDWRPQQELTSRQHCNAIAPHLR